MNEILFVRDLNEFYCDFIFNYIKKTIYYLIKKFEDWIFLINVFDELNEINFLTNISAFTKYTHVHIHAVNQTSPEFYK